MNPRVKTVVAQDDYTLLVAFMNGEKGLFDVKPFLYLPVFQPIKDKQLFNLAKVGNGNTVCWSEDIDICPDTIYEDCVKF